MPKRGKRYTERNLGAPARAIAELFSKGGNQFDAGNCQLQELTRCSQGEQQLWSSCLPTRGRRCRPRSEQDAWFSVLAGKVCANLAGLGC